MESQRFGEPAPAGGWLARVQRSRDAPQAQRRRSPSWRPGRHSHHPVEPALPAGGLSDSDEPSVGGRNERPAMQSQYLASRRRRRLI